MKGDLLNDYLEGFRKWDSHSMALALIEIVSDLSGRPCSASTREEIFWLCRETLEDLALHPYGAPRLEVQELPHPLLFSFELQPQTREMLVRLSPVANASNEFKSQWLNRGFSEDAIRIPRDGINAPHPLKGEPGYPGYDPSKPTVHHPPGQIRLPPEFRWQHALDSVSAHSGNLLDRYLNGEQVEVWNEIAALGTDVRLDEPLPEAMAVITETARRIRANIQLLVERLQHLGYTFNNEPFIAPDGSERAAIHGLEDQVGALPLSLCAFAEMVGSVDLTGSHPNLQQEEGAPHYPDPLCLGPLDYALQYGLEQWYRYRYRVDLSPDEYHKEDVSGGPAYAITLPNPSADAPFEYEWHETTLIGYLRECFRCGGFPGLVPAEQNLSRPVLLELADGLLPI